MKIKQVGVYQIQNLINGKVYIGSSIDLATRKYRHFLKLKINNHVNLKLQRAFNKYGEGNLEFSVIEYINDSKDLLKLEQWYLNTYSSVENGYNICSVAGNTLGKTHSQQTKDKLRALNKFRVTTEETKKKIGNALRGEKSVWFGREHTKESKQKISKAQTGDKNHFFGKTHSEKVKLKISESQNGENNSFYGKLHSLETRQKISEKAKSQIQSEETKLKRSLSIKQWHAARKAQKEAQIAN